MTSVLNGMGYQGNNPIGNQIRSLQRELDNSKKDLQMLLDVLQEKNPEVFNGYKSLKDAQAAKLAEERARAADEARRASMQSGFTMNRR
jgi:peptidoglycan hydrolase CwlO-like protein